jgi:hypothetical protein
VGLFSKSKKPEPVLLSRMERVREHQRQAEDLLARSAKGGRLEAETRLATMANAHATLAVSYLLSPEDRASESVPASSFGSQAPADPATEGHAIHRTSSDLGLYEEHRTT